MQLLKIRCVKAIQDRHATSCNLSERFADYVSIIDISIWDPICFSLQAISSDVSGSKVSVHRVFIEAEDGILLECPKPLIQNQVVLHN